MRAIFVLAVLLLSINSANAQTHSICSGEFESECKSRASGQTYDTWCKCCDVHAWARDACKVQGSNEEPKYTQARTLQQKGNRCGYEIWRFTCR
jgi:hypothetical protein